MLNSIFGSFVSEGDHLWQHAEWMILVASVLAGLFVLLNNQLRRDRFFRSFIPTVIPVVVDKETRKILVVRMKKIEKWILSQGQITESIVESAEDVLLRELNLERSYDLQNGRHVGAVKFTRKERQRLERVSDASDWSMWPWKRGKSYIAILAETEIAAAEEELKLMFKFAEAKFVSLEEAEQLLSLGNSKEKMRVYKKVFAFVKSQF